MEAIVQQGDVVGTGQMIARPGKGLSVGIHASISGKVIRDLGDRLCIQEYISHNPQEEQNIVFTKIRSR